MLCRGPEQPLIIGRPMNFTPGGVFVCTFGSRYHCGVRTFMLYGSRNLYVSRSMRLFSYISVVIWCASSIVSCLSQAFGSTVYFATAFRIPLCNLLCQQWRCHAPCRPPPQPLFCTMCPLPTKDDTLPDSPGFPPIITQLGSIYYKIYSCAICKVAFCD